MNEILREIIERQIRTQKEELRLLKHEREGCGVVEDFPEDDLKFMLTRLRNSICRCDDEAMCYKSLVSFRGIPFELIQKMAIQVHTEFQNKADLPFYPIDYVRSSNYGKYRKSSELQIQIKEKEDLIEALENYLNEKEDDICF